MKNKDYILIGVVALILIAVVFSDKISFLPLTFTGEKTRLNTISGDCVLFEGLRSCEVDRTFCRSDGSDWFRDDLDCLTDGERVGEVCFEERTCTDTLVLNCQMGGGTFEFCDLFCNIEDYKECIGGCNENFKCRGEIIGCDNPVGDNGHQTCINRDVHECRTNEWILIDGCGDVGCNELNAFNAQCESALFFCTSNNIDCFFSNSGSGNCFDTEQECLDNREVYCLNADRDKCTQREGNCLEGEFSFRGSDVGDVLGTCEQSIVIENGDVPPPDDDTIVDDEEPKPENIITNRDVLVGLIILLIILIGIREYMKRRKR